MTSGPTTDDIELAHQLADLADGITMGRFLSHDLQVTTKPDMTPVTEADRNAEAALRAMLQEQRPGDGIVGEELGVTVAPSEVQASRHEGRTWVIDPIDGTKNYVRGVPIWATLVALVIDGVPRLGVVSAPALNRRWWGLAEGGAWLRTAGHEHPISVSGVSELADSSFSYSDRVGWGNRGASAGFDYLLTTCWRTRGYGDFYSHMLVAEGAVDIAAEPELNPWDIAALVPIVHGAGGRITGYDGSEAYGSGCAVTTNGVLHSEVLDILSR